MKKDDLYALIKTLSPAEKKVFKERYAAKADANFIRLFDAIAGGEVKEDTEAKKKFGKENFVKHLGKAKSYLYEALLTTLHEQLQPHFVRLRILQKIELAEVLFGRKLLSQAEDEILDALAEAQKHDELELEHYIRHQLNLFASFLHRDTVAINHDAEFRQKLEELLNRNKLYFEVMRAYGTRGKKNSKNLSDYRKHPLLAAHQNFLSPRAENVYEIVMSLLNTVERNYEAALQNNYKQLELKRTSLGNSATLEVGYINTLFNTILALQGLKKDDKKLIDELEKFEPVTILSRSQKFVCLLRAKLGSYTVKQRSAEGGKLMAWVEKELPEYNNGLTEIERVKIYISVAGLYMKEQQYNKALDYLPAIYNTKATHESRPIIERVTILYMFICHYELGNYELLGNTLRNYKYFQQTNHTFYLIENMTFDFLKEAIRIADKKEREKLRKDFQKQILKAAHEQKNSGIAYLQNIGWI